VVGYSLEAASTGSWDTTYLCCRQNRGPILNHHLFFFYKAIPLQSGASLGGIKVGVGEEHLGLAVCTGGMLPVARWVVEKDREGSC
jgi:hypothetical protein